MAYDIQCKLPGEWISEVETYEDESGSVITHLAASCPDGRFAEVYAGPMPEGETPEDQAFANYAETVGFSEDDPEDYNPIAKFKFNGKSAWGFDALCDDGSSMRFLSQEVRRGLLAIIVFGAADDSAVESLQSLLERTLRVK